MDAPTTIVLPLHNAERTLRTLVAGILDLASGPARRLQLAIIDDGSTDDTYETACELARDYPQVHIFRQRVQTGLGPALAQVRRRLSVNEAIVYDGIGPIDLAELAALIGNEPHLQPPMDCAPANSPGDGRGSRRFASVTSLNARMVEAHRTVTAFQWLSLADRSRPRRAAPAGALGSHDAPAIAPLEPLGTNTFAAAPMSGLH